MAAGIRFTCSSCSRRIEGWSDGNPFWFDEEGKKRYAYHPDHERLERCVGNDDPHLCLECGAEFMVDSQSPRDRCPECSSAAICATFRLEGKACPFCKSGRFCGEMFAIS